MKRFAYLLVVVLVIIAAFLTVGNREAKMKTASKSPKLVVGIVIDQMRYDYIHRYWDTFSENGFKRLVNGGFACENHHFSYKPTETAPGHASIYSGTTPSIHGVIANNWWLKDEKRSTYCVEDTTVLSVGINSKKERRSPRNILVTNLSDEIKLAYSYRSKVIGISAKDRGSILPAGKLANAAYWFTGKDGGKFISSTYYMDQLPKWVQDFNDSNYTEKLINKGWDLLYAPEIYVQSNEDNSPYEGDFYGFAKGRDPVFPYDLKRISADVGDYEIIKFTPMGNELITNFALSAMDEEDLGSDEICDVLTISYSSPDEVGHIFGPRSMEIQDTYIRLDLEIAKLLAELDEKVGKGKYLTFLTSDHGIPLNSQEMIDHKVNVGFFERTAFRQHARDITLNEYGVQFIDDISNQQIFLNEELIRENNLDLEEVEDFLAESILDFPGIYKSTTASTLQKGLFDDQLLALQKGYNQKRSGHVLYTLKPGWRKYEKRTGSSHSTAYAYDTHVPFILYGWNIPHGSTTRRTWVEDIAPTITSLLHVNYPMGATGNPVWEVANK